MPVRILAADDSVTMRKILEMSFAGEDVEVACVGGADEALLALETKGADVALLDAALSGMDGYALAQAIRRNPATASTGVVLLVSQHHPFDSEKGKAAGVDDHVSKPFDTQVLLDKVADVLRRPRAQVPARAVTPTAPPPPAPATGVRPTASAPPAAVRVGTPGGAVRVPSRPPAPTLAAEATGGATSAVAAAAYRASSAGGAASASAAAANTALAPKLAALGLTAEQVDGVLRLSRDVVEQVVWEVVPELAETIIREEIRRLTAE